MRALSLSLIALVLVVVSTKALSGVVSENGLLSINKSKIVNSKGQPIALAGMSFFWSNSGWAGEAFYNQKTVDYLVADWGVTIIRAAMGIDAEGGLVDDPENLARLELLIHAAIKQDIYIIVDFHSHHAEDYLEHAKIIFDYLSKKYGHYPNIIYEIYNEPLKDTDWKSVIKPYAETIIPIIRKNDPDNIIVVGTQAWSQEIDKAARLPLEGFSNIAYTLHFYAGTHHSELRRKAQYAIDQGLPLMVTEWGTVNATGDGAVDHKQTKRWLEFMQKNHLSHCNWSVSDKAEGASIFKPNSAKKPSWSDADLTESGTLVKQNIKNWQRY